MANPVFIGSDIYRTSRFGGKHPLAIPRVSLTFDLCRAMGWLPVDQYIDSPVATVDQLARFHDRDYIAAVKECEETQHAKPEQRERYGLGVGGNPVFGEIFRRPATAAGATLYGIDRLREGGIVYTPAGGTHHGLKDRASGFCFFNDAVLGILSALDRGATRVAYLDIDAHHCDGVELAVGNDPRVFIASVHERDRWPRTGHTSRPSANIHNFPVAQGFDDKAFEALMHDEIIPAVSAFAPQLVIIQCGADALDADPLSRLSLSNASHARFVESIMRLAPRLLVTGGGGYNPWTTARCWTRIWAVLCRKAIPDRIPHSAEKIMRSVNWNHSRGRTPPESWFTTIADERS